MKIGWIIIGTVVAGTIGVVAFLSSTKADAANKAMQGFRVAADCSEIEIIDQAKAEASMQAAALSILPSMDDPAVEFLDKCLAIMFPQCAAQLVEMSIIFQHEKSGAAITVPLGFVRLYLHGKTVGDVRVMLETGMWPEGASSHGDDAGLSKLVTQAIFGSIGT